jgi:hypothetical protein
MVVYIVKSTLVSIVHTSDLHRGHARVRERKPGLSRLIAPGYPKENVFVLYFSRKTNTKEDF